MRAPRSAVRLLLPALAVGALVAACDLSEGTKYGNTPPSSANLPVPPDQQPLADGGPVKCDGGLPDAGPCSVSFATTLWPNMAATGKWLCASTNCHGGVTQPVFQDPAGAYTALSNRLTAGKPYINPCSTDPAASSFYCNMGGGGTPCGNPMPLNAPAATMMELDQIRTWVQCGAPNN